VQAVGADREVEAVAPSFFQSLSIDPPGAIFFVPSQSAQDGPFERRRNLETAGTAPGRIIAAII
jgi:hypothetical protein